MRLLTGTERLARLQAQLDETAGWGDDHLDADHFLGKPAVLNYQAPPAASSPPSRPAALPTLARPAADTSRTAADVSLRTSTDAAGEIHIHLTLNITNPPIINNIALPAPIVNIENKIEPAPVTVMPAALTPAAPAPPPLGRDIVITKIADGKWTGTMKPAE
jgi:hypothetical protein